MGPPLLAITGGIACGKSTFGRLLAERGADVLDADDIVHRHQSPGGALVAPICSEFGTDILTPDGAIHRPTLAKRVFADASPLGAPSTSSATSPLARLNAIIHPFVREEFKKWQKNNTPPPQLSLREQGNDTPTSSLRERSGGLKDPKQSSPWAKIGIIPLLFESGWESDWDLTLCVTCSPQTQRQRAQTRGWSEDDLHRRLAAQWPLERKRALADIILDNSTNDLHLLAHAADELYIHLVGADPRVRPGQTHGSASTISAP